MDFFMSAGQIIDPNHGKFIIFADTFGVSASVDLLDLNKKGATLS